MHVSSFTSPLSLDPTSNSDSYHSLIINNNNHNHNHNHINSYHKTNNNNFNFFITALILGLGFLFLFRSRNSATAMSDAGGKRACAMCGEAASSWCAACKKVYYCSSTCQLKHWKSEHKANCKGSSSRLKSQQHKDAKPMSSIALVPDKLVDKVLFSYDVFLKLFDWDLPAFAPCGLLNCGNSCFANVVLQCLAHTRPLVAYLLKKGHRRDCRRNEWCFLCELEAHMDRVVISQQPFSPINILSRLPSMGGNMGYGRQEDAHEFMRFAIDMMQSVCLDEHGGEKVIHPKSQETTLIQHIFGGQLRSQVKCTKCYQVSDRYENMMDLTVEIQGDITSLQECLDQFTETELLHGENKYKCDRCKDYVVACKRLTIHQAPNILTVTLKRFQGGNFGKINKKVAFPESLDLGPYMSEERDDTDKYELYAVVVHMDMLNASFFGHYICYTKGFQGDWYWIDDCKVTKVELDEVLSQGAYMLMYKRISARPKCLKTSEVGVNNQSEENKMASVADNISLSQLSSSLNSSDSGRKKECEGYKVPAVADDISPSQLPGSLNSVDPCTNKEHIGDKMLTVANNISPSHLPSPSNSSDPCMKELEGDKVVTVVDDFPQSQPPSSSCMKEHEGDKMVTVKDDFSQSQPPSSSNSSDAYISNLTTTVEKEQLEPLVSLSLAASHESTDCVSEDHSTVLPVSDGCELSEPASNKSLQVDPMNMD